ncbi:trypsin-like peptidase domain-containing protein [Streptomyces roseirectus]|uniref:VMAP-C domain-containing protein n=1 Tax=Streptomyces roseirectus TaxID=2768066 RepID=UPI003CCDCF9E
MRIHRGGGGYALDEVDTFLGSGFFVAPNWVLTCAHVACGGEGGEVAVVYRNSPGDDVRTVRGRVVATVPERPGRMPASGNWPAPDLALVQLTEPADDHECVYVSERPAAYFGEGRVLYAGWTFSEDRLQVLDGTLSVQGTIGGWSSDVQMRLGDNDLPYGVSGGPVIDLARGEVIGVLKARSDHRPGGTSTGIEQLRTLRVPAGEITAEHDDLYQAVFHAHDRYHRDRQRRPAARAQTWTEVQSLLGARPGRTLGPDERVKLLGRLADLPPPASTRALLDILDSLPGLQGPTPLPAPRGWRDGLGTLYESARDDGALELVLDYVMHVLAADRPFTSATTPEAEEALWHWVWQTADPLPARYRVALTERRMARLRDKAAPTPPSPGPWPPPPRDTNGPTVTGEGAGTVFGTAPETGPDAVGALGGTGAAADPDAWAATGEGGVGVVPRAPDVPGIDPRALNGTSAETVLGGLGEAVVFPAPDTVAEPSRRNGGHPDTPGAHLSSPVKTPGVQGEHAATPAVLLEILPRPWEPDRCDWSVSVLHAGGGAEPLPGEERVRMAELAGRLAEPLGEAFRRCDEPGRPAVLQVAVPHALLGVDVDTWRIGTDTEPLGALRPVVVRVTDRDQLADDAADEEWFDADEERRARWKWLHTHRARAELLDCADGLRVPVPTVERLRSLAHATVPVLCRYGDQRYEDDAAALARIVHGGYGVALWRRGKARPESVCGEFHRGSVEEIARPRSAARLPQAVHDLRAGLREGRAETFWADGVALLYDDPHHPLPGSGDLLEAP